MRARGGGGADDANWSRGRRGRGEGAETHHETHVEAAGGVSDDVNEIAPVKVGLGADQKEYVRAVAVTSVSELDLWPGQFGGDAVNNSRQRTPSALVNEVLGIEGGEDFGRNCLQ